MKKVLLTGLVCLALSLPAMAEDGSSSIFQEIYSAIATWIGGSDLEALAAAETSAPAPGEENFVGSEPGVPPATAEMSPMTFPGG